jgi:Skp family chaperone for outer membrane proteins
MRSVSLALPLGLVAGLAVAAVVRSAGAAPNVPARVAVVDVLEVLQAAPAKVRIEEQFKAATQRIRDFTREERARFEKEAGEIELMLRTDPKRRERERALERSKVTSEFDIKARLADAQKEYFDALENLWREVRAEVRRLAAEQGFSVVVSKTEDELNVRSHEEFILNVAVRNVLHYDADVDVTDQVKARMAARGAGGSNPSAVPPMPGGPVPGPRPGGSQPPPTPNSPGPGR